MNVRYTGPVRLPKHTTTSSAYILRTYANMIIHVGVTQETLENIDPNDMMITTDIIKDMNDKLSISQ